MTPFSGCIADDFTSVPWTESLGKRSLALALKSRSFGAPDFFQTVVDTAVEELEETARLRLLLLGKPTRFLTAERCAELRQRFPS